VSAGPGAGAGLGAGTGRTTRRATRTGTRRTTGANTRAATLRDAIVLSLPGDVDGTPTSPLDDDDAPLEEEYPELGREDDDEPADPDEERADAVPSTLPARAQLAIWIAPSGAPQVWVPSAPESLLLDPMLAGVALARQQRLAQYGAQIGRSAAATLAATTLPDAFDALEPTPAAAFAAALEVDEARVSEDRDIVVRIPAGLVPLGFFTSKQSNDSVVDFLWRQPDLMKATAAELCRRAASAVGGKASAADPYIAWLRAARGAPGILRGAAARFERDPRDMDGQTAALGAALIEAAEIVGMATPEAGRGKAVLQRAIYGGLR